jgi:hypothetical protein
MNSLNGRVKQSYAPLAQIPLTERCISFSSFTSHSSIFPSAKTPSARDTFSS